MRRTLDRFDEIFLNNKKQGKWLIGRTANLVKEVYECLLPFALELPSHGYSILAGHVNEKGEKPTPMLEELNLRGDLLIEKKRQALFL